MKNLQTTTIAIEKGTRDQLKALGHKGETYDHILAKLIEIAQQHDFYLRQKRILEKERFVPLEKI